MVELTGIAQPRTESSPAGRSTGLTDDRNEAQNPPGSSRVELTGIAQPCTESSPAGRSTGLTDDRNEAQNPPGSSRVELTGIAQPCTESSPAGRSTGLTDDRNEAQNPPGSSRVELTGIEAAPAPAPTVVDDREMTEELATSSDARQPVVSASAPTNTDDAIRLAAKLAIDAGEYDRARALIDLLDGGRPANRGDGVEDRSK